MPEEVTVEVVADGELPTHVVVLNDLHGGLRVTVAEVSEQIWLPQQEAHRVQQHHTRH